MLHMTDCQSGRYIFMDLQYMIHKPVLVHEEELLVLPASAEEAKQSYRTYSPKYKTPLRSMNRSL